MDSNSLVLRYVYGSMNNNGTYVTEERNRWYKIIGHNYIYDLNLQNDITTTYDVSTYSKSMYLQNLLMSAGIMNVNLRCVSIFYG